MVGEELLGGVVVLAGGVVVAFADALIQVVAFFIHVAGEAVSTSTAGTRETGGRTTIVLK